MTAVHTSNIRIVGPRTEQSQRVLTRDALSFVASLHAEFADRRGDLLKRRAERWNAIQSRDAELTFPSSGPALGDWRVAPAPKDLDDRRVEITGPAEAKMMINALNSGASVFMADLEDALSPTWANVVDGQGALMDAVRRTLTFTSPEGKRYALNEVLATLLVRPRGWHLEEAHAEIGGRPASASLFDFGLYFFHNAREALDRGTGGGRYFYLPKLESHLEARLWNDVFNFAQDALGIPRGSIRATMLVETIYAAFEMEEILYELREHAAGLNAGRWDYLFSLIKVFRNRPEFVLPDRARVTMAVPFMRAYAQRLVQICHRHGAHAIGGMAAFVPSRKDKDVNERALEKVREDKERESGDGFDGTWVAHPDLVPVAKEVFDRVLGSAPHQKGKRRDDVHVTPNQLLDVKIPGAAVTAEGVRTNIDVALQYLDAWLRGTGAVGIHNLMEDAATAEISRSQLWQWITHRVAVDGSGTMSADAYRKTRSEVVADLREAAPEESRLDDAVALLDELVLGEWQDFLTLPGYKLLKQNPSK